MFFTGMLKLAQRDIQIVFLSKIRRKLHVLQHHVEIVEPLSTAQLLKHVQCSDGPSINPVKSSVKFGWTNALNFHVKRAG